MSRKKETVFAASVNKHLPTKIRPHREKMSNPWRSGTADWWYSSYTNDLWVEYKYVPKLPVRAAVKIDLTPLQRAWINDRYMEGRNVAVIVGCPLGGVLFRDRTWEQDIPVELFRQNLLTRKRLAEWIAQQTGA